MEGNSRMATRPAPTPMLVISCCIVLMLTSMLPAFAQNTRIDSFNHAKKLLTQVFAGHAIEFYCECSHAGSEVDLASCGSEPKKDPDRAKRIEWEHIVPAEAFGQSFPEWREGHPSRVDRKGKGSVSG